MGLFCSDTAVGMSGFIPEFFFFLFQFIPSLFDRFLRREFLLHLLLNQCPDIVFVFSLL